ncbi:MFS general substrate transporter [Cucurbitaria berberidis CBS 394.84]|uniref:MFS general substrate transporter n=1 Tax=Cucurbitaria berberidis CBS 394.84 TaxID=1168544 RepID=A0A9P4GD63_9PLEO|nr:MFS general substrate transporter [Cucurbitaria berberidis CBS 394.84]KAF1843738.1 MFS general substrate transporter [Cucurbitaria berberidis CBS 394.84]
MPDNDLEIEMESSLRWNQVTENESSLPPPDGGKDAWLFLAAGFVIEIMVWGFPWSYGIFQDYYSTSLPFAGSSGIPAIGTSAMGILYMAAPITFGSVIRYPQYKRPAIVVGLLTMCLSLALSSLCTTVPQLVMTQGILYGIGGAVTYSPVVQFLDEWFVRRKGLAFGIMWAGTGVGGVITPLLLEFLLHKYGFRNALRIWTILVFVISLPLTWFLKPRLPVPSTNRARLGFTFLTDRSFWIFQLGSIFQSLGFFVPSIYLPTYAKQLGFDSTVSALTIVLINVATVFGSIGMGSVIDRWPVTTGILISTTGAVLSVFLIWGFSTTLPPLLIFSFSYGLFAGSFTNTWPGILRTVQKNTGQMEGPMVFSILSLGRGIGNVISGPLSEALIKLGTIGGLGFYGTHYGSLVIFTGITAAFGGIGVFGKRTGWL